MTDQQTNSGTPAGGTPGGDSASAQRPSMPAQPEPNPRARGHSPAADARQQQQTPPQETLVKFADGSEHREADLLAALGDRAERQSQRATLPATPADYRAELTPAFSPGEGVRFELDQKDPLLAQARELAFAKGLDQSTFSSLLDLYAASKVGDVQRNAQMRDFNLKQLGAAAPTRIESVSTWLAARAGADGKAVGDFLRQWPSAPIVKALERVMQYQSSQGGADFSQQHRETQANQEGKLPGDYSSLSFIQKRTLQVQQMLSRPGYRGGGGRNER